MDSSILQNPSDPEATFRSKAGEEHRGYVANMEESVGENGSVITDYRFEQNTYSDSQFLADTLTAMEPAEEPVTIATDGAYPTPGNQKLAETRNVHIVSTNMPGKKANDFYAGFELSDDGKTIPACPGGIEPVSCGRPYKNGQMRVTFPSACCGNCPYREQCPAGRGKRISAFVLSLSSINRAKTQWMMSGEEGADYARFRNGVETLPSGLRRNYHTDKLPRGRLRGKLFFVFKIGALLAGCRFPDSISSGLYGR
ncbi:MAG: transposase [Lachnospiraceae bacterium]|nr:transposase [Lachnospiraceae bacterium]